MNEPLDFETRESALRNAVKLAQAQRYALPLSGRYSVFDVAANNLDRIIGGQEQARAEAGLSQLANQQRELTDPLLAELNAPGMKTVQGPNQSLDPAEDATVGVQHPMTPMEDLNRKLGIYQKLSMFPRTRQLGNIGVNSLVDAPERMMVLGELTQGRLQAAREAAAYRLEAQRERLANANQQNEANRALRQSIASLARSSKGASAQEDANDMFKGVATKFGETASGAPIWRHRDTGRMFVLGPDGPMPYMPSRGAEALGAKVDSDTRKKVSNSTGILDQLNNIEELMKKHPNAFGAKTYLPNAILQRLDAENSPARKAAALLSAEQIHEMYGSALTAGESARANTWAFAPGDTLEEMKVKAQQLRKLNEDILARLSAEAAAKTPTNAASGKVLKYNPATGKVE